jgi:GNAT superfamily N-acetyltransferase
VRQGLGLELPAQPQSVVSQIITDVETNAFNALMPSASQPAFSQPSCLQKLATRLVHGLYQRRSARGHAAAAAPPCRDPLPQLLTAGKPICAATIRVGLGYLEVSIQAHFPICMRISSSESRSRIDDRDHIVVICLQVPFFATAETKRNRGYGRALLEAIEDVAR